MSTGFMIRKSLEYSTLPRAFRGALSRSTITAFSASVGSTSPKILPRSFSYGPVLPNDIPSAKGTRDVIRIWVMRASDVALSTPLPIKSAATKVPRRRLAISIFMGLLLNALREFSFLDDAGLTIGRYATAIAISLVVYIRSIQESTRCARVASGVSFIMIVAPEVAGVNRPVGASGSPKWRSAPCRLTNTVARSVARCSSMPNISPNTKPLIRIALSVEAKRFSRSLRNSLQRLRERAKPATRHAALRCGAQCATRSLLVRQARPPRSRTAESMPTGSEGRFQLPWSSRK